MFFMILLMSMLQFSVCGILHYLYHHPRRDLFLFTVWCETYLTTQILTHTLNLILVLKSYFFKLDGSVLYAIF